VSSPRILLFLPSLAGGGAERVFVELANEFVALGLHVDLALASAEGPYLCEVAQAVRVVDFAASGVARPVPKLARHLRSERPAAVLSGLDHANVMSLLARAVSATRTRCVISTRSVPTMLSREAGHARAWVVLQGARIAYRFADAMIANSEGVASDLSRYLRLPRNRITVIYNPLNLALIERLSQEPVSHPCCAPGAPPFILSVGRISPLKDFPTLVRAFSIVRSQRDCRLVILGEGPDREELELLIRELGLEREVHLPGFVGNPFSWMRHAGVFVSSSLSEGCPNALMQALACGTAVVSTNAVGGSAETIQHGKWGSLVPVGDSRAMAEAVVTTLDATTRPDVRQRANDFSHDRIARQYLEVLLPGHFESAVEH
jgi:glycosyltransferase involved in cell wall biosynthesis